MLLVRVFVDAGIVPPFDPRPYERDWHLHRSEERYLGVLSDYGYEIDGDPQPGEALRTHLQPLGYRLGVAARHPCLCHRAHGC